MNHTFNIALEQFDQQTRGQLRRAAQRDLLRDALAQELNQDKPQAIILESLASYLRSNAA